MSDAEIIAWLIKAIIGLCGVVGFLFFRLEALTRRVLDQAVADVEADNALAQAIEALAKHLAARGGGYP